jgi:hypothetical protein
LKASRNEQGEVLEEQALFTGQFKGKGRNCGQVGQKSFQRMNRSNHNDENSGNGTAENFCSNCHKLGHEKKSCFKLEKN